MNAVELWERPVQGTRRERRRRRVLRARQEGRYGPALSEVVLPFAGIALGAAAVVGVFAYVGSRVGWWAAVLLLLVGVVAVLRVRAVVLQRRRREAARAAAARRRTREHFTLDQVDAVDDDTYRRMVAWLLRRDGWIGLREVPVAASRHIVARTRGGVQLGLACERGGDGPDTGADRAAALRPVAAPTDAPGPSAPAAPVFVVVSTDTGGFTRARVVWAARSGVHLVDRAMLGRWAAGEHLADLLHLDLGDGDERPASA